ncbi:MAG: LacI family transcriptional regulator [Oscillospiraceae bacterium]|jgi:LacI family transcriptional regulator|nr:LacI family transcriptional regulator [Oscillospiraceae bacterium]
MSAATMKDIARVTGLSLATISKHLNGGKVLEENQAKIEKAIEELDFRINEFARGLKTNKTKTIGLLIPDITTFFYNTVAQRAELTLRQRGYSTLVYDSLNASKTERDALEFLINRRVDGILALTIDEDGGFLAEADKHQIPVVLIDRSLEHYTADSVCLDNYNSFYNAIEYLIVNGHEHIGLIVTPMQGNISTLVIQAYTDALKRYGLPVLPEYIYENPELLMKTGYKGTKHFLEMQTPPTAIINSSSELTLGSFVAISELRKSIPEDISFVGLDLLDLDQISPVKLTHIFPPVDDMVDLAIDVLLSRISGSGKHNITQRLEFKCEFRKGDSVADISNK